MLGELRVQDFSLSCPALTLTKKSISELSALMFLLKRQALNISCYHVSISEYFSKKVLSRDSVTVSVDAVVYYRVSNPTMVNIYSIIFKHFLLTDHFL